MMKTEQRTPLLRSFILFLLENMGLIHFMNLTL